MGSGYISGSIDVALLTEGVDRNIDGGNATLKNLVALLTEGVDRNINTMKS